MSQPWPRCPEAAAFFQTRFDAFCDANPTVARLARRLADEGAVDLAALVDHWIFPPEDGLEETFARIGLEPSTLSEGDTVWAHPAARLPKARIKERRATPVMAIAVDSIDDFAASHGFLVNAIHGDPDSSYRCGHLKLDHGELMPIERRGYIGFAPGTMDRSYRDALAAARAAFEARSRPGDNDAEAIAEAARLFAVHGAALGKGRATDEFFAAERAYYLERNRAAQWQLDRQTMLGIGWANHDHHTYRSSRSSFKGLTNLFLSMGFVARERFYAGADAGWGAQVFEHPTSRVVIFADVDIAPEELDLDFSREKLEPRKALGTIGLWCALHGSSIGAAGMHHMECEFLCRRMVEQFEAAGNRVMAPFTDLPMLWQAFTDGEKWRVPEERLQPLVASGQLSIEQAEAFAAVGALGSHLEILQRWDGFKGFNKTAISNIIRDTDARRTVAATA